MKHLSSILLAAAFVAAGVTACFKDPTGDLINGPMQIQLTRSSITLRTGDSLDISAEMKDAAGNTYSAAGTTWTSADETVAVARVDTTSIPGNAFSRAFVRGTAGGGGVTTVTVSLGGLSAQFRVLVLPAGLAATAPAVVSGTTSTDTILATLPGGAITRDIFTVGDTVTFSVVTGSKVYFSTTASLVSFGTQRAYIVARTDSTRIKVIARGPFRGRPWVTALHFNGPAETGTIAIDSLQSDTVVVARPRYRGAITQTADTMFVNAQTGSTFATNSAVRFGATSAIVLTRSTAQLKVISPVNWTGLVTVTNVVVGSATVDSLKSPASYTISKASFGGTVVATANLLDTVKVYGTAITKFTTTPAASASQVSMNGVTAFVLLRTADSMYVIAKRTSTGPLAISNVNVGGTIIPTLNTANNVLIGPATNEANEPGNDSRGATSTVVAFTGATDTITVYGSLDCEDDGTACPGNGDLLDYYQIAYAGGEKLRAILTWFGNGNPGASYNDTNNPDVDVAIRDATGGYLGTGTGVNGSGLIMPEVATTSTVLAADTYYFRVMAWVTPSPITYQLKILRTP